MAEFKVDQDFSVGVLRQTLGSWLSPRTCGWLSADNPAHGWHPAGLTWALKTHLCVCVCRGHWAGTGDEGHGSDVLSRLGPAGLAQAPQLHWFALLLLTLLQIPGGSWSQGGGEWSPGI